jgi:SAM-dependent methyltransferase
MKRFVKRYMPESMKSFFRHIYYRYPVLRRIYYFPVNLWELALGKHKGLRPPRSKIFVGDGNFESIGREFLDYFITLCRLKPGENVLEVGSGIGRMAIPLTGYLDARGSYTGMDIVAEGVKWCKKKITPRFPNFNFFLSDIYNDQYNPGGRMKAIEYRFPIPDNSFDFVFLTSVFTHMLRPDIDHYLEEISRVLRPGGRTLITFFLLNDESLAALQTKNHPFKYSYEDCLVIDSKMPEASIAHPEARIRELYERHNLLIVEPVHYGDWSGRKRFVSSQDMIIAVKSS